MTLTYMSLFLLVVIRKILTFRMPLHFLSAIYNVEISLKEAEISQRKIEKKIEELKFDDRPKNEKEKEINGVLMQANDLFEYRDKIINAFFFFFFLSGFSFTNIHNSRDSRGRGRVSI